MKLQLLTIAVFGIAFASFGQTEINKTVPYQKGQNIRMHFDYPELIKISTWDGNTVVIQGMVSINNGENDDAFLLETNTSGNTIDISARIKDMDKLPQRITIDRDGQKIVFKDKAELRKYQQEHGRNFNQMNIGVDMEIMIEIKVPRNVQTRVESVYGMVEVKNFSGPLIVESTYGGVDAALMENAVGEIVAETNYGEIYSNLKAKFFGDVHDREDFHTLVSAKLGAGPKYELESKYGNVYIRKSE
jgi:hypothetical protein